MSGTEIDMNEIVCSKLKDIINIFPVVANVEDQTKIQMPWAVYRIQESETPTKDSTYREWNVSLFIASESHDKCKDLSVQCLAALKTLKNDNYAVCDVSSKISFDQDDRAYIGELSLTIKE